MSDSPAGKYEYLGDVRNPDGTPFRGLVTFGPGVINDDGVIRLYFGTSYFFDEYKNDFQQNPCIGSDKVPIVVMYMGFCQNYKLNHINMARKKF